MPLGMLDDVVTRRLSSMTDTELEERLGALDDHLGSLGSVLVAFSGGADSAFLLAAAVRALGAGQRGRGHGVLRLAAAGRALAGAGVRRRTSGCAC